MTTWVVEDWSFWIWAPRCDECNAFLKDAKPVMHRDGGVDHVEGKCFRHGEVQTHSFDIGDIEG